MAVVTSSVPIHCNTALEHLDLAKYFERITFAQSLGLEKKGPEIWLRAAADAGVEPETCTMFDDSIAACRGARLAPDADGGGLRQLLRRRRTEMRSFCDVYIKSFEELLYLPVQKERRT